MILPGQHQAPGGGIHEQGGTGAQMLLPVAGHDLVADQLVGGVGIRDAQQGFGEAHEHHAFLGGQVVLAQEFLDAALG